VLPGRHLPWLLDSAIGFDVSVTEETEAVAASPCRGRPPFAVLREAGFEGVERLKIFDLAGISARGRQRDHLAHRFNRRPRLRAFRGKRRRPCPVGPADGAGARHGIRAIAIRAQPTRAAGGGADRRNADFVTAEHAVRGDRLRMPDEIGLGSWSIRKRPFQTAAAPFSKPAGRRRCGTYW